mmetsp:Transcript_3389/g.2840  ORF Transcript_3389/g.2840 Transcript_3389/m.2840 type:complete len:93 (+) Transcript_3389:1426-1704(+)
MIKELDLVTIVDAVRKVNVLSELILNEKQKILAEYQPLNYTTGDICSYPNYPKDHVLISKMIDSGKEIDLLDKCKMLNMNDPTTKKLVDLIL